MTLPEQLEPLRDRKIWLNYILYEDDGKLRKPPVNPNTLGNGSSTDSGSWATFDEANANIGKEVTIYTGKKYGNLTRPIAGVGVSLEAAGLTGVDFDHVIQRDEAGKVVAIKAEAKTIWQALDSYAEVSVSGTGVHALVIAKNPNPELNQNGLPKGYKLENGDGTEYELYDNGRYFTVSGKPLKGSRPIAERQAQIDLLAMFMTERRARLQTERQGSSSVGACDTGGSGNRIEVAESDGELWAKMFSSARGSEIKALYDGDLSGSANDHSRADQALCNHLAYWTNCDEDRIDRMFRESGLMREKWERNDYRSKTIKKALERSAYTGYTAEEKKAYAKKKQAEEEARFNKEHPDYNSQMAKRRCSDNENKKTSIPF